MIIVNRSIVFIMFFVVVLSILWMYILIFYFFYLKGTVNINEHENVNMPELAKCYFPSEVPGGSEQIALQ